MKNLKIMAAFEQEVYIDPAEAFRAIKTRLGFAPRDGFIGIRNGELVHGEAVSYDMLTTDEFNGEDILVDEVADTAGQAEKNLLLDKLREGLQQLSPNDQQLIQALYVQQMTEREYASICGIYHNAIHKQKKRILAKLKENLKN